MRRCPQCSQLFDDEMEFCVDDGSRLAAGDPGTSGYLPTQIFTPLHMGSPQPKTSTMVYILLGAMGSVIVTLTGLVYFFAQGKDPSSVTTNVSQPANHANLDIPKNAAPQANKSGMAEPPKVPTIREEDARQVMARWEKAQDERNFEAYRACYYSQAFLGIKRTADGGKKQYNFGGWMSDRQKMLRNVIEVRAADAKYFIDGDAAVAEFTQHFRSLRHCDIGEKTIRIKMFADGPKIIYEEMKYPRGC